MLNNSNISKTNQLVGVIKYEPTTNLFNRQFTQETLIQFLTAVNLSKLIVFPLANSTFSFVFLI